MLTLALLLLSHVAPELAVEETVEVIERNRVYHAEGFDGICLGIDQLIFRGDYGRELDAIVDFRLCAGEATHGGITVPLPSHDARGDYLLFHDGDKLRKVRYRTFAETVTGFDVELLEREDRPKERRYELR
jgi:hypothetical protein